MSKGKRKGGPPPQYTGRKPKPSVAPATQAKTADGTRKTVLLVGWGTAKPDMTHPIFAPDTWQIKRLDIFKELSPDYVASPTAMSPVADDSVDAVWCPHLLQRVRFHEAEKILAECYRVLKETGFILTTVPDLQVAATWIADDKGTQELYTTPAGPVTALDIAFGFRRFLEEGQRHQAHRCGFSAMMLGQTLQKAGFTNVRVQRDQFIISAGAHKYRYDHPDRVERVTVSLTKSPASMPKVEKPKPVRGVGQQIATIPPDATGKPDELDRPPEQWKKLNLKK